MCAALRASIIVATCAQLPNLDPDDHFLVAALTELGARVRAEIWSDPDVDWRSSDVCLVRSTWDYHKHHNEFVRWADEVSAKTTMLNAAPLLRWNSHKFYLRELENQNVPIVPTIWLKQGSTSALDELLDQRGWSEAVVKPSYGASSDGIMRVGGRRVDRGRAQQYLGSLLEFQDVLLQQYVPSLTYEPERALVFIDGEYSHAVSKMPFMHANADVGARARRSAGSSGEMRVSATVDEVAFAAGALSVAPAGHVYGRVDVIRHAGSLRVMEVELIEPTLYLFADPKAAGKLARAVLKHINLLSVSAHDDQPGVDFESP